MFKPASNFMIIEVFNELEGIVLPENMDANAKGTTFIVKAIGPEYERDDIHVGDRVAIYGQVLKIPAGIGKDDILIASASNVIAYESLSEDKAGKITKVTGHSCDDEVSKEEILGT